MMPVHWVLLSLRMNAMPSWAGGSGKNTLSHRCWIIAFLVTIPAAYYPCIRYQNSPIWPRSEERRVGKSGDVVGRGLFDKQKNVDSAKTGGTENRLEHLSRVGH